MKKLIYIMLILMVLLINTSCSRSILPDESEYTNQKTNPLESDPTSTDPSDENPTSEVPTNTNEINLDVFTKLSSILILPDINEMIQNRTNKNNLTSKDSINLGAFSSSDNQEISKTIEDTEVPIILSYTMFEVAINTTKHYGNSTQSDLSRMLGLIMENIEKEKDNSENRDQEQENYNSLFLYDFFYLVPETSYYFKINILENFEEGIQLILINPESNIHSNDFIYIEVQTFIRDQKEVLIVKYCLYDIVNPGNFVSIYIERHGDSYIRLHEYIYSEDLLGRTQIGGSNIELIFEEKSFDLNVVGTSQYYDSHEVNAKLKTDVGVEFARKNELDEFHAYLYTANNPDVQATYAPNFYNPNSYIWLRSQWNDEIYISPFSITNLKQYSIRAREPEGYLINKIILDDKEINGVFGHAYYNEYSSNYMVFINNNHTDFSSKAYLEYLISEGTEFDFDVLAVFDDLTRNQINIDQKSAFGFEPMLNIEETHEFFTNHYSITLESINYINEEIIIQNILSGLTDNHRVILFDSNGGTNADFIIQEYETPITKPKDPIREGYIFDGWFTTPDFLLSYEFNLMPIDNIKLYAKWIPLSYGWRLFTNNWGGKNGEMLVINDELVLNFYNINTTEQWHIQLIQDAFSLGGRIDNEGSLLLNLDTTYRVKFDARASVSGNITLSIGNYIDNWTPYFVLENIEVNQEMTSFVIEFTLNDSNIDYSIPVQFKFEMGLLFGQELEGSFIIDNVLIEVLEGEEFVDAGLIVNGTFE